MSVPETETAVANDPWMAPLAPYATAPTVETMFEDLSRDVIAIMTALMDEEKITRSQIAKSLGTSVANVTQCMRPNANLTLKTITRMLHTMGYKLEVQASKL